MDKQHIAILVLSALALILAAACVMQKKESFDAYYFPGGDARPLISTMSNAQMQAAMAQPTCQASLQNLCSVSNTGVSQGTNGALENAALAVANACGPNFPAMSACNVSLNLTEGGKQWTPTM